MRQIALCFLMVPLIVLHISQNGEAGDADERVRLDQVHVITLKHGHRTNGRRSAPINQLRCVGGTARCEFQPQLVQCYNKGSDGTEVQWECKADLSNKYRFGEISVVCEGFDYPEDPYVLKGSCGLEYQIDFTEEKPADELSFTDHVLVAVVVIVIAIAIVYLAYECNKAFPDAGYCRRCDAHTGFNCPCYHYHHHGWYGTGSSGAGSNSNGENSSSSSSSSSRTASGFGGTRRR